MKISENPSLTAGSLKRDAKPVKAILGKMSLFSGFKVKFNARTALLCSQIGSGVLTQRQRTGTLCFLPREIQTARVSMSAFVLSATVSHCLSRGVRKVADLLQQICLRRDVPLLL